MQKAAVQEIVSSYLSRHPEETERLRVFTDYLTSNDELFSRKNFNGHITTSGIVLDPTGEKVLLIFHNFLRSHLQPGGHFEGDSSLSASAAREVLEETGVVVEPHSFSDGDHPWDIDTHWMPPNDNKGEDGHWHFDFRYLFTSGHGHKFALQEEEVAGCGWHGLRTPQVTMCFDGFCLTKLLKIPPEPVSPGVR